MTQTTKLTEAEWIRRGLEPIEEETTKGELLAKDLTKILHLRGLKDAGDDRAAIDLITGQITLDNGQLLKMGKMGVSIIVYPITKRIEFQRKS